MPFGTRRWTLAGAASALILLWIVMFVTDGLTWGRVAGALGMVLLLLAQVLDWHHEIRKARR